MELTKEEEPKEELKEEQSLSEVPSENVEETSVSSDKEL